jgi:plastocyanin
MVWHDLAKGYEATMKKIAATLLMGSLLALAACGGGNSSSKPTVTMTGDSFSPPSLTINKGQSVTFDNSSDTTHLLVTGMNGQYQPEAGAPSDFENSSGLKFSPGTKMVETFNTPGTYKITCTVHPTMEETITVK